MNRIIKIVLLFIFLSVLPVSAQDIPQPIDSVKVYDFAGVLPAELEKSLNAQLESYKEKTSIEIAVVTVSSLQQYTVEDFTIRLAQNWGVGNKEKDNGIVLLLAPNEREVRIEVGYGLEGDLTDGQSGSILDENAVPYFRNDDWAGGVNATVSALINYLGQKNYQTRLTEKIEREKSEQVRRAQAEAERVKRNAEIAAAMGTFFFFAVPALIVVIGSVAFYFWYKRRKLLKEMQKENFDRISNVQKKLEEMKLSFDDASMGFEGMKAVNIDSLRPAYSSMLTELSNFLRIAQFEILAGIWKNYPRYREAQRIRESVEKLEKEIPQIGEKIRLIRDLPALIEEKMKWVVGQKDRVISKLEGSRVRLADMLPNLDSDYRDKVTLLSNDAVAGVVAISSSLSIPNKDRVDWNDLSAVLVKIESSANRIEELLSEYFALVERAKSERDSLLADMDEALRKASEAVKKDDVKDETVNKLRPATVNVQEVRRMTLHKDQEWVLFLTSILAIISELDEITRKASNDIEEAEKERRRVKRQAEEAEQAKQAKIKASQADSHRSSSSRSSGFGGGSFGGGGASRKF
ncbi:MAG: TPM domain-containing protein [Candidatus Yanofskybacteria bacterium]|nr:TPM domain-containing protein [Candidatus Yanofskybacteria bacterium]